MSDLLVEIQRSAQARRALRALGLPLPEPLRRQRARAERPLDGRMALVVAAAAPSLLGAIARALAPAGATPLLRTEALREPFEAPGEAHGRRPRMLGDLPEQQRIQAIVLDASGASTVDELRALREEIAPALPRLERCGRVVVLARPEREAQGEEQALAQAAVEGFVRSLAKELGRSGSTANLLRVEAGADERLGPALVYFLSDRSAFVTGQPLTLSAAAAGPCPVLSNLERKVAVVTGAARGIGAATARALAADGARVLCVDRPEEHAPASQLARELKGEVLLLDVTSPEAPGKLAAALAEMGGVDVVVHNAGVTRDRTLARMKPEHWDTVMAVNAAAPLRLQQAIEPLLRDGGRVIVLSSIAGIAGNVGQTTYAATKAGVAGWTRAMARRLAHRGITANAIAPGFIETRMTAAVPLVIREAARRLSSLGQGGDPDDVASAIAFLASPGAIGVSGATLRVCGGAFIGA